MITTAYREDGTAVDVDEAESGGGDGLICDCGVPVVAKKGPERDWHFAHQAGLKSCRIAIDGQMRRFLENAALDFRIELPPKDNRRGMVDAIVVESVVRAGLIVLLLYDQADRKLLVVVEVKKSGAREMRELIGRSTLSAIFVSLVCHRTKSDEELRNAFCRSASREWWRWKPELLTPLSPKIDENGMLLPPLTEEALLEKIFRTAQR
ncbi:competence protein CoiA family protein [Croceicoccus sp. Ery15]|uniref:competence protein CoiA family protein n=1 Tax=Croceicoccus sp. Ery15 TaxID=1703338 RepID=UPI001E4958AE|nr:competence protein CoiA family protein [Croceicoccus sp. Ery15]